MRKGMGANAGAAAGAGGPAGARTHAGAAAAPDSPFIFAEAAPQGPAKQHAAMRDRFKLDRRARVVLLCVLAAVLIVPASMVLPSHMLSAAGVESLPQALSSVAGRAQSMAEMFSGTAAGRAMAIQFWQTVAVAVAGAVLALNGAVYQGALKNALASPSTLGVMSGATLGAVLYTLLVVLPAEEGGRVEKVSELAARMDALDPLQFFLVSQQRMLWCLAGCAVVVALVLAIAYVAGRGHIGKVGLLVSGQVFTAIIASAIEMIRLWVVQHGSDAQMNALRAVMGGGFENIWSPVQVAYLAVPAAVGVGIVLALRHRLNLLAFHDDEARSMGLSPARTRNAVVVVCTVLTALVVSFCGSVGFVGFLVPHLARRMVGPDFRYYLPCSLALGSAYLLLANYLMNATGIFQGSIGTFTSLIGIVFFVVLAVRQRARGDVDWA